MINENDARQTAKTYLGAGWTSVIVDAHAQPEGSNENAVGDVRQDMPDGAALLASIQAAGRSWQEFQAQSRAQADRLRELVAEVREHVKAADARAAEAEARARAAEERARVAETWLAQISEAVQAAFPACTEPEPAGEQEAA